MRIRKKTVSGTVDLDNIQADDIPRAVGERLGDIVDVLLQEGYTPDFLTMDVSPEVDQVKNINGVVAEYHSLYLTMEGVKIE